MAKWDWTTFLWRETSAKMEMERNLSLVWGLPTKCKNSWGFLCCSIFYLGRGQRTNVTWLKNVVLFFETTLLFRLKINTVLNSMQVQLVSSFASNFKQCLIVIKIIYRAPPLVPPQAVNWPRRSCPPGSCPSWPPADTWPRRTAWRPSTHVSTISCSCPICPFKYGNEMPGFLFLFKCHPRFVLRIRLKERQISCLICRQERQFLRASAYQNLSFYGLNYFPWNSQILFL